MNDNVVYGGVKLGEIFVSFSPTIFLWLFIFLPTPPPIYLLFPK